MIVMVLPCELRIWKYFFLESEHYEEANESSVNLQQSAL